MVSNVLELVPESIIKTWRPGDHVMIEAGTGKCKTTWVKQVLWPYCKARGLSLYTLANRIMLRDDIQHGTDMPVVTYQLVEHRSDHPAWRADFVVLDECHSIASDIRLDPRRNKLLELFQNRHTIVIGLTATPISCVTRLFDPARIYQIPRDCSHIERVTVYYRAKHMYQILNMETTAGGKVLCFMRSSRKGKEMHAHMPASSFVCSKDAPQWNPKIEDHKRRISDTRNWGDHQVLISTKVMDNGVSIEDALVTAVIIETDDYTVDLIQMIGRIRCLGGQRIRLYIRLFPKSLFVKQRMALQKMLEEAHAYVSNLKEYRYNQSPLVLGDGTLNEMAAGYCQQRINDIDDLLAMGAESVISSQLCQLPIHRWLHIRDAEAGAALSAIEEVKHVIAQLEGKNFEDRHELLDRFEPFIQTVLKSPGCAPCRRNVNKAFVQAGLGYQVIRKQHGKGHDRGRYYFSLVKT